MAYEPSLGRDARTGSWEELARGTFREAIDVLARGRAEDAAQLVEVSLLEAQELREIYEAWPIAIVDWLRAEGVSQEQVASSLDRLSALLSCDLSHGIEEGWPAYVAAVETAAASCRSFDDDAPELIEQARLVWQQLHDDAVDRVSGVIDIAVKILGESRLVDLWDVLLADWYGAHATRYDLENQSWDISTRQLMVAIVDGFHAHLAGTARQGDIEVIEEKNRVGFRFAPCGSGGRSVDVEITNGRPLAGAPYEFAVTTEAHDWAWNKVGVCSYCVHCCLLNEVMPIDRLGYPTRVIDPPTWPESMENSACTWWVYRHPSLVPDEVYARVGRTPENRPPRLEES